MQIAIFGTSGFAREVADICWAIGYKKVVLIGTGSKEDFSFEYEVTDESNVDQLNNQGYQFIIGIGNNLIRSNIAKKYNHLRYTNIIHPTATFGKNQLDKFNNCFGNIIAAGVRFTNNIEVSDFGIYNLNSTIGHDCMIGEYVNLSPNTSVSGNVRLGRQVFVGTNASIIQGKKIGAYSVIGAGAVVIDNVPDNRTVVGVPAKIINISS